MEKYFEKFGSNFIVSAFVPSLTFVTVSFVLFSPLLPPQTAIWFKIPTLVENIPALGFLLLLFGVLLSFTLTSLNTFVLKVMEGYVLYEHFPMLLRREKRKARKLRRKFERKKAETDRIESLIKKTKSDNLRERYIALRDQKMSKQVILATSFQGQFPWDPAEILPTRFGNILKSAEYYAMDRYRIDSVPLWSRMVHVIDKDYMELIDESRNELSFLVNCSVLCLAFGLMVIPISVYVAFNKLDQLYVYVASGCVALAASYIFHRASLFSVGQYGDMIRATYDLFRKRLLKALGFAVPNTVENEKARWETVCEFINAGEHVHPMTLDYEDSANENEPKFVIPVERVSGGEQPRQFR